MHWSESMLGRRETQTHEPLARNSNVLGFQQRFSMIDSWMTGLGTGEAREVRVLAAMKRDKHHAVKQIQQMIPALPLCNTEQAAPV